MSKSNITDHQAEMLSQAVATYMRIENMQPAEFIAMLASLAEQAVDEKFEPHNLMPQDRN